MQMIGRKKEMQRLESLFASKKDTFMLITGRKYVGKTTLVRAFAQNKNTLFYSGGNVSDTINRNAFYKSLKQYCGGKTDLDSKKLPSWKELFVSFAKQQSKDRKVLILDNFHYLVQANPDILNVLKSAWTGTLRSNYVMVILIAPQGRLYLNLQDKGKAFMSTLTHRMKLNQLSLLDLMNDYPHHDFNQLMTLYSIVGGIPRYLEYFKDCVDRKEFIKSISNYFMSPYGDLFNEPIHLIEADVAEPSEYHSVLFALANDRETIPEVAAFCGFKVNHTELLIQKLVAMGYIRKVKSIVEKRSLNAKRTAQYEICDPFLSFWYTYVFAYYEDIKNGVRTMAIEHLSAYFDAHIQKWFKEISMEILASASARKTIPIKCDIIGPFFNRDEKIDVVGIDHQKKIIFFGDCHFGESDYEKSRFDVFVSKCENIRDLKEFKDYKRLYGVFSNHPFDKELMDYSLLNKNILLFNGITMYSLNS